VFLLLAVISAGAVAWFYGRGYLLHYGDAQAHLAIARRVIDSRSPGYEQLGTVWLPLPHLLMLPFVAVDGWWRTGLAGSLPTAACFVLAGLFLFVAVRRWAGSGVAWAATLLFATNLNLLYLQSIAMTEAVFFCAMFGLLASLLWYRDSGRWAAVGCAVVATWAASMTRYEGWFLIPFAGLALLALRRRWKPLLVFGVLVALAPLYWFAHNWWIYGDVLEFYSGPYSAKAIYQRQLEGGMAPYPGDHHWGLAVQYFAAAARLTLGWPLWIAGLAGVLGGLVRSGRWVIAFLLLPPVFYIWSLYSSGTPIFVPDLWPNSYYNTRYGLAFLPAACVGAAALGRWITGRPRAVVLGGLVAVSAGFWVVMCAQSGIASSICWKESEVNSEARRAWTREAAGLLGREYRPGDGILLSFGDLTGVLREAGIPIREALHEGNRPQFDSAMARPDLFLFEKWAMGFAGDKVVTAAQRYRTRRGTFVLEKRILQRGGVVEIYRLQ
jgi:hypothetical protein